MNVERFRELEKLYHSARELTGEARRQYLEHVCGDSATLCAEVESMLTNDEIAAKFFADLAS
jgi:hypothetical protein